MSAQANTGSILERILEARRAEVEHRKKVLPETALKYGVAAASPVRDFAGALSRPGLNIIAELKPASPWHSLSLPSRNSFAVRSRIFAMHEAA